ncbi:toprim domain-containing protein [Actinomadura sp. 9N407]|uniref:toprim domain-containing protein n=1 Tax=Actinomadura sp. 9N407 TaxID=3375154 RepID=UPI0037923DA8
MPAPARTPDEEARQNKERRRRVEILNGIAEHELSRLYKGELSWGECLAQARRHGRYGFTNTLLIAAQHPSATDVRSYDEWKRQGRQVVRGETAIRIVSRSATSRSVFDVKQTDGRAVASQAPLNPGDAFHQLHRLASDLKLYVDRGQSWSYAGRPERRIPIPLDLGDVDAATLLAHQLAHVLQRGDRRDAGVPCHGVRRVRTDSIAYLVLAHLGMDVSHISFSPVRSWAGEDVRANPQVAIKMVGEGALRVASQIRRRLEALPPALAPRVENSAELVQPKSEHQDYARDVLLAVHSDAHAFYRDRLAASWAPGYLVERGFGDSAQQRWQIGYAPAKRNALVEHLRRLGYANEVLVAAGLAKYGPDGKPYDTFRDRVLLPLREAEGAIVGFIGRRRDGLPGPKYLNSPETAVFRKGELLFGLHEGRARLNQGARALIAEGPLDVIALDAAAIDDHVALAPCGTAITAAQLDAIARHADLDTTGVLLALDGDRPGAKAMLRAWNTLKQVEGPVEAVCLPDGRDPADVFRHHGCAGVREALHSVRPLADLVVDASIERSGGTLEFAENKLAAARAAANLIAQMRAPEVARQVARVATRTGLDSAEMTAILTAAISPEGTGKGVAAAAEDFPLAPLSEPTPSPGVATAGKSGRPGHSSQRSRHP